jgi:hypothetical protein
MTRYDFTRHFKTACNTLGVWEYDEPDADVNALDAAAAKVWKLWMFPHLFDGFDPAEWQLSDAERTAVVEQVNRYREAAERVTAGGDPAVEVADVRAAFQGVYHALRPRLFDAVRIRLLRDLRRICLSAGDEGFRRRWVRGMDTAFDVDFDGDPVIYMWLVVPDDAVDDDRFWEEWNPLRWPLNRQVSERAGEYGRTLLSLRGIDELVERVTGVPA